MKLTSSKKILMIVAAILVCGLAYYFGVALPARNQGQALLDKHSQAAGRYMQEKNYAAAAKEWRQIVRLQPDDPDAQLWLGTTLYRSGQKREAAEVFKKLATRNDYAGEAAKKMLRNKLNVKS